MGVARRIAGGQERRQNPGHREVRLYLLDARSPTVRERIAAQIRTLDPTAEEEALTWAEQVSILNDDDRDTPG